MSRHNSISGHTCEFTDWLFELTDCKNKDDDFFYTPYCLDPEELKECEKEEYEGCLVVCFRLPGYTVGHLYVKDGIIKGAVVYDREEVNRFKYPCFELEELIKREWIGKQLFKIIK